MYANAQASGEGAAPGGESSGSADDEVVDAEIVDEDGANG
jgi:hypothetical protein